MQIIPPLGAGQWEHNLRHASVDWQAYLTEGSGKDTQISASFFVVDGKGNYWIPADAQLPQETQVCAVYLGSLRQRQLVAQVVVFGPQLAGQDYPWTAIRDGKQLSLTQAQLYAAGNGLAAFHLEYQFCHACGGTLKISEGGWARTCTKCQLTVYPRQDPAIIVAIMDGQERLLLAHNANWPAGRVSLIAGFVNMGEAAEQTVVREVAEEVGLVVKPTEIQYLTTQTWPFPRSLMLAYKVVLSNPPDPQVDGEEITWANWYSRKEYLQAVASGQVSGPVNRSVAAALVGAWLRGSL